MKRTVFFMLFVAFVAVLGLGAQDQAVPVQPAAVTQFDQVLLQKGTLTVKEFIRFQSFDTTVKTEIAILTNANSGKKVFALRLSSEYYNSKYDTGTAIGILDAKEIDSAINSLDFMINKNSETPSTAPYTEVIYKSNGDPSFGFYVSGTERVAFFEINNKKMFSLNIARLPELKQFFERAKQKIIELGGE